MTFINLNNNQSQISSVVSKFSIFSLMLRNIRSYKYSSNTSPDANLYHDSLHMIYSNNTTRSNCPVFLYKPYIVNSQTYNYETYNNINPGGLFQPQDSILPSTILLVGGASDSFNATYRFFSPDPSNPASPNYSYLRFYTGDTTFNQLYAIGSNNTYRPDINTCIIPKIRLKGGFEYYIEIFNNTNRIKFSTETTGLQQISLRKENSPLINSDMSKIYINNDSYNPHLYASYVNKNANEYDIFSLTYKFDNYDTLASQWASRFIIHQIPIV